MTMMSRSIIKRLFLLARVVHHGFAASYNSVGIPPCDALVRAGLENRILFPSSEAYESVLSTYWSANSRLRPWCMVQPHNATELAVSVVALRSAGGGAGDWHIAVRSGGHGVNGINNINKGVTIDLSKMNSSVYDAQKKVARLEPGARWKDAFASLQEQGVVVPGGRDGGVGVGGFLLGGGNSYYMGRRGFGCDSVINYEVVLANGTITSANQTEHADLWKALKGGGSNFGIVTRFDVETLPAEDISYTRRTLAFNKSDDVLNALFTFTNLGEAVASGDALFAYYAASPDSPISITTYTVNTYGNVNSSSFHQINNIPSIQEFHRVWSVADAVEGDQAPAGTRNIASTLTFRNDEVIAKHSVNLWKQYVEQLEILIGSNNFATQMVLQPLPTYFSDISERRGGNMLGIKATEENAIMWVLSTLIFTDEAAEAIAHEKLMEVTAQLRNFARSLQGDVPLVYLNYADSSQDALGSYGAENIEYLRTVAARYDPDGFFQSRVPGGSKISRVEAAHTTQ